MTENGMNEGLPEIISPELINFIKENYQLHWNGIHGWAHWLRVLENGMHIARQNGASQNVVALFAFTHDMARRNDGHDPFHGPRAAEGIRNTLQGTFFSLTAEELHLLTRAVELHTRGLIEADVTIQTCWDADRLDLGRVGIRPAPHRLCTPEARNPQTLAWAYARSTSGNRA